MKTRNLKKAAMIVMAAAIIGTSSQMPQIAGNMTQVCAQEQQEKTYENFTYVDYGKNSIKITKYNGTEKEVTIPGNIDGKVVVKLDSAAFRDNQSVEKITIEEGVKTLVETIFNNCASLKELNLPASLKKVESCDFEGIAAGCPKLEKINVAENGKGYASIDGVLYTADKGTLLCYPQGRKNKSFKVPKSVKVIDQSYANYETNPYLKKVILPKTVKSAQSVLGNKSLKDVYLYGNTAMDLYETPKKQTVLHVYKYTNPYQYAKAEKCKIKTFKAPKVNAPTKASAKVTKKENAKTIKITWKKAKSVDGYEVLQIRESDLKNVYRFNNGNQIYKKYYKVSKKKNTVKITEKEYFSTENYVCKVRAYKMKDGVKIYSKYAKTVKF